MTKTHINITHPMSYQTVYNHCGLPLPKKHVRAGIPIVPGSGKELADPSNIQSPKRLSSKIGVQDSLWFRSPSPVPTFFLLVMLVCLAGVDYRQRMLFCEGVPLRILSTAYGTFAAVASQLCTAIVSCHPYFASIKIPMQQASPHN